MLGHYLDIVGRYESRVLAINTSQKPTFDTRLKGTRCQAQCLTSSETQFLFVACAEIVFGLRSVMLSLAISPIFSYVLNQFHQYDSQHLIHCILKEDE